MIFNTSNEDAALTRMLHRPQSFLSFVVFIFRLNCMMKNAKKCKTNLGVRFRQMSGESKI
jgi:hypothetical protein